MDITDSVDTKPNDFETVLKKFEEILEPYSVDPMCVFKVTKDSLVIMKKCVDTETNEERNIHCGVKEYAEYRANKLQVVDIFDRYDPSKKTKQHVPFLIQHFFIMLEK